MELKDVLLTDKELNKAVEPAFAFIPPDEAFETMIMKAQCLKLIEWLDKPCKEHPLKFTCDTSGRKFEQPEYHYRQRLHCPNCMAELKKQLGGE